MTNRRTLLPILFIAPTLPAAALAFRAGAGTQAPDACRFRCDGEQVIRSVRVNAVDLRGPKPADGAAGRAMRRCPSCGRPIAADPAGGALPDDS